MTPCESCGCHVRVSDATCPGCGARPRGSSFRSTTAAAMLMGLVACTGATDDKSTSHSGGTTPQPEYGVTVTDTTDTPTDMPTDMATHESGGSGSHSGN